jgi:hypothetical protein
VALIMAKAPHMPHHPAAPALAGTATLGQALLQLSYEHLPLVGAEIFLDIHEVMHFFFFQL